MHSRRVARARRTALGTFACCALCFAQLACSSEPFSSTDGGADARADLGRDIFGGYPDFGDVGPLSDRGRCEEVIDLVFVLDLSSSMSFVLDTLKAEIDKVVVAANGLKEGAHFGLVPFVDNHVVDLSGPEEGGKVHVAASTLQAAFDHYKKVYTEPNRNPGDGPTGPTMQNPICEENSLDALYAAATEFPWRETATRVIIVATDDTFLERPDNYGDRDGDGKWDKLDFPSEGNYPALRTVPETVAALKASHVRVFAFTRTTPPFLVDLNCGTGRRLPASEVPSGWSAPYNGNQPIPEATSGKNFDLMAVRSNQLSLTDTINDMVLDSHCRPLL